MDSPETTGLLSRDSTVIGELVVEDEHLWRSTYRTYFRNTATVVSSGALRMMADSVVLSVLGEDPRSMDFGFATRCQRNSFSMCLAAGMTEFLICLLLAGVFVWHFQEKLGAAEWLPMTVLSAQVRMVVSYAGKSWSWLEWLMVATFAFGATLVCTLSVHAALRRSGASIFVPQNMRQYLLLLFMYCMGTSVGTAWWLIIYVMLLKPYPASLFLSIFWALVVSICATVFYKRFGPEPIMPHGNHTSTSLRRSALSFMVYASVVCTVNANHSAIKFVVQSLHSFNFPAEVDSEGLALLAFMAWFVTMFAAFFGYWITRTTRIGFGVSGRFSRMAVGEDIIESPWGALAEQSALTVMAFDSLSLLSAFQWGGVYMGSFVLLVGSWALRFTLIYVVGCVIFATTVVGGVSWFCRTFIPSDAEKTM
ncbi:hypothetical protein FOZ61_000321 [Perkinsus olseni]|uniref:Transmembrane protein n=1 Tax=Perkinsus olseni TaxID=32597 RepID=A0A7J6KV37_PEROL|nr:hypothetical protein FOZ61_000321 [Perkinsus olseni]